MEEGTLIEENEEEQKNPSEATNGGKEDEGCVQGKVNEQDEEKKRVDTPPVRRLSPGVHQLLQQLAVEGILSAYGYIPSGTMLSPEMDALKCDPSSSQERRSVNDFAEFGTIVKSVSKDLGRTVKTAASADGELGNEFSRFATTTSAHGIPMALIAKRVYIKGFWICLSISLFIYFIYQCTLVFDKYQRNDKIVNVELQFQSAPFPAITICNLNPFKRHLARTVPEISETLDAFHQAVTYSKDAANQFVPLRQKRSTNDVSQYPGGFAYVQYAPVMSDCYCAFDATECTQRNSIPPNNDSLCICNFDRQDLSAWPCFKASSWIETVCPDCNDIGYCNLPETNGTTYFPCMCQTERQYCLLRPERLKRMWEMRGKGIPDASSPYRAEFLEQLKQLGYENMTDEVAITTKTKERMVLTMASLPVHRRIALSYGKAEFIKMCSFNGRQCDIVKDFKLHVDPAFGNCYTFNANRKDPLISSRAGPSYGLRIMLFVNATDYLPTTEATGVRIAIHDPAEYPFPDTFGYSAPTGAISSFGLSMRKVNRLSQPYGDCVESSRPLPSNYIYKNYKYEPEGCYKSCYQSRIIEKCACADPRYPKGNRPNVRYCNSFDPISRDCLIVEGVRFTRNQNCRCQHSCQQDVYSTTYSAAKWPSGSYQVGECASDVEKCIAYYSFHAAMVEIYYEQMNYEVLTESVSYLVVNLISDIGGQAGLWLGASVITLIEVCIFVFRILTIYCRKRANKNKRVLSSTGEDENDEDLKNERKGSSQVVPPPPQILFEISPPEDSQSGRSYDDYRKDNRLNALSENHYEFTP